MPAVPLIISGAVSAYSAYKQGKTADAQKQIMGQQSGLANEIGSFARGQSTMAQPALSKAMQYYTTLATGNRGAIDAQLASERAQTVDTYAGAEKGLINHTAAGPSRDRAIADLYKQRAGQLGIMPFQARQNAVGQLGSMGQSLAGNAIRGYEGAGSALTGASNTGENYAKSQNGALQSWNNVAANAGKVWDWYNKSRNGSSQYGPNSKTPGPWQE